jgi:benzoylsuccinyl-CoA thiolase BbsB subunit
VSKERRFRSLLKVYVLGAGIIRFGRYQEQWLQEIGSIACQRAIRDANLGAKDIQVGFCSHSNGGRVAGQRILKEVGIAGIEITNIENACAGGSACFRQAYCLLAGGFYDTAIVIGVDKMYGDGGLIPPNPDDLDGLHGRTLPARYAMAIQRHMYEFGTNVQQLGKISVKNRKNGVLNPYAQYQTEVTLEEVLNSRMISDPLTLLQCCPNADGAAAVILGTRKWVAKSGRKAPKIAASIVRSGRFQDCLTDLTGSELAIRTATEAYEAASCDPEDIDVCELHDAFTAGELMHYENLGFCKKGEGGRLIDEGAVEIGGRIPVNPSGGLLSRGHPLGATGVAQIAEILWQLRSEAGKRQVAGAKVGLSQTIGGVIPEVGSGACSVNILIR